MPRHEAPNEAGGSPPGARVRDPPSSRCEGVAKKRPGTQPRPERQSRIRHAEEAHTHCSQCEEDEQGEHPQPRCELHRGLDVPAPRDSPTNAPSPHEQSQHKLNIVPSKPGTIPRQLPPTALLHKWWEQLSTSTDPDLSEHPPLLPRVQEPATVRERLRHVPLRILLRVRVSSNLSRLSSSTTSEHRQPEPQLGGWRCASPQLPTEALPTLTSSLRPTSYNPSAPFVNPGSPDCRAEEGEGGRVFRGGG